MPTQTRIVIDELEDFVEDQIKKIIINGTAGLIEATPIETGFARANWVPSIATGFDSLAGTRADAEEGRLDTGPQTSGIAAIATYRLERGPAYITNNVDYITRLNMGSSRQAPAMFVESVIAETIAQVAAESSQ